MAAADDDGQASSPQATICDAGAHATSLKGEDRHSLKSVTLGGHRVQLALVADGHGGAQTADFVNGNVLQYIVDAAVDGSAASLQAACEVAFARANDEVTNNLKLNAGCTLTVVAYNATAGELSCANVGDSLALLVHEEDYLWLTTDHRIENNADERQRIAAAGGKLERAADAEGNASGALRAWPGGVAVARTIGDAVRCRDSNRRLSDATRRRDRVRRWVFRCSVPMHLLGSDARVGSYWQDCVTREGTLLVSSAPSFWTVDVPPTGGVVLAVRLGRVRPAPTGPALRRRL
eukprot:2464205-Prymnesium_polylepis.1